MKERFPLDQHVVILTWKSDDDLVLVVQGMVQGGLSSGAPTLESSGLRFDF